jgi:hypothetical protein
MYSNKLRAFPQNPFIWVITLQCGNFLYSRIFDFQESFQTQIDPESL